MSLSLYLSFCKSSSQSMSSPDDKLSENIWLAWSRTSYGGDKWRCHHGDEQQRTRREYRATQLIDTWSWVSQIFQSLTFFIETYICVYSRKVVFSYLGLFSHQLGRFELIIFPLVLCIMSMSSGNCPHCPCPWSGRNHHLIPNRPSKMCKTTPSLVLLS